jgi:Zn-dependent protease with chaperone function
MNITATRFATQIRTWLLVAGLTALLIAIGGAIGGGALWLFVALAVLIGTLAAIIIAPIAAMLLQLGISRQREFLADATGAQLLGQAAPLADALTTLERGAQALPMDVNPATASLYAVNPLPRRGLATLFMTHPPLAERIKRLRAMDGERALALAA